MKIAYISQSGSQRLVLVFAGWAMDPTPFAELALPGYDIAVAWDYRTTEPEAPEPDLGRYSEICIVAWSYGVAAAATFMRRHPMASVTRKVAVNGTPCPVHPELGIAPAIFEGTLKGLSDRSLEKFNLRMCGGKEAYERFCQRAPHRPVGELADELRAIAALPHVPVEETGWDAAYIGLADRIIPAEAQRRAWEGNTTVHISDTPHLPDFNLIMRRECVSKTLVRDRFSRAASTYRRQASPQLHAAEHLLDMWLEAQADAATPDEILEIGAGSGVFTSLYTPHFAGSRLTLWDIAHIDPSLPGVHAICDAETAIAQLPAESLDVICSASTVQWFNSPLSFLQKAARALRPEGLIAISTYGPRTFHELGERDSGPACYPDKSQWMRAMPADIELVAMDQREEIVEFDSPRSLLEHLKLTGVNAVERPDRVSAARAIMRSGLNKLTYQPLTIIGRKR